MKLILNPSKLAKKGQRFIGQADAELLVEIAHQLKILRLDSFSWDLIAKPWGKKGLRLDGTINGTVAQACVITLSPIIEHIEENVDLRFAPEETLRDKPRQNSFEEDINFEATPEEEAEVYSGDEIDFMPFAIEHLALGLNPYPRSNDAVFVETEISAPEPSALMRALQAWSAKKDQ